MVKEKYKEILYIKKSQDAVGVLVVQGNGDSRPLIDRRMYQSDVVIDVVRNRSAIHFKFVKNRYDSSSLKSLVSYLFNIPDDVKLEQYKSPSMHSSTEVVYVNDEMTMMTLILKYGLVLNHE